MDRKSTVSGIYVMYFETDDKLFYVGKANSVAVRYKRHCSLMSRNKHKNRLLQEQYNKYGLPGLIILEEIIDLTKIYAREIFWIKELDSFNNGLNLTVGGEGVGEGFTSPLALYPEETYILILKELAYSDSSIPSIAIKLSVTEDVVSNMACGIAHTCLQQEFPKEWQLLLDKIGTRTNKLYTLDEYQSIVEMLSEGTSLLDVSTILDMPYYIISSISQGVAHRYLREYNEDSYDRMRKYAQLGFRTRKHTSEKYVQVLELLATTKLTYREIEEITLVNRAIVGSISIGGSHSYLKDEYPEIYQVVEGLRKSSRFIGREPKEVPRLNSLPRDAYISILTTLATTSKKLNVVAKEFNVDEGIIEDISRGSTHRYLELSHPDLYALMIAKKGKRRAGSHSGEAYPAVKDPKGKVYSGILNAKQFALENNLHPGHFGDLLRGKARSHVGWTLA